MSQDELARKLGYKSRSSINKIERDASGLPQNKIRSIAYALDTTPAYIMGWTDDDEKKPTADDGFSEKKKALIEFAQSVPEDKAELILKVIRSIVEAD